MIFLPLATEKLRVTGQTIEPAKMERVFYSVRSRAIPGGIMVRKFLLVGIAAAAFCNAPAIAATPAPAPVFNWSGFYLGVNGGGNWGSSDGSTSLSCAPGNCYLASVANDINSAGASQRVSTSGFTGGIQGGYNWQFGNLLAGLEADFEYFRSAGSTSVSGPMVPVFPANTFSISTSVSTNWLFTARPRSRGNNQ